MKNKPRVIKIRFALYSADCMSCKHLSPETGTTAFSECHYKKGNDLCPAEEVTFNITGEAQQYAQRVKRARDKRQALRETKLMRYVSKQSDAFRSKFYEYLENPSI